MNNKKKTNEFKIIEDTSIFTQKLIEWQEHLFKPFYYTGGKIPPFITHTGRPVLLGWASIMSAVVFSGCHTFIVIPYLGLENLAGIIVTSIFMYGITMLQIIGGIRLIKKENENYFNNVFKSKKFIITSSIILIIIISSIIFYNYNQVLSEKVIISTEQYSLEQINYENFIYLDEPPITLICSNADYRRLWKKEVATDLFDKDVFKDTKYILVYKWNKLNPKKGKLIEIKEEKIK